MQSLRTALGPLPSGSNAPVAQAPGAGHFAAAPGQENAPVASKADSETPASKKLASKKRKSTKDHTRVASVDLTSVDLDGASMDQNCDQVRRKITRFLDSGTMTKTAFAREIGVSATSLHGFLGTQGPDKGTGSAAYGAAWKFFKKREIAGIKLPLKKQKTSAAGDKTSAVVDISDIYLSGEDDDDVPVFDTCDEVRKKIDAHLRKPGVTQAQFCRDIYAQLKGPCRPARVFQSSQLAVFRNNMGPISGAKSKVFYAAYVFFEKLRIKQGKPKSKHRLEMEEVWGFQGGLDRSRDGRER